MTQESTIIAKTRAMVAESNEAIKEAEIAVKILEALGERPLREKTELQRAREKIKTVSDIIGKGP